MFGLGPATKVYLAVGATDMRKGFDGGFDGLYGFAGITRTVSNTAPTANRIVVPAAHRLLNSRKMGFFVHK